MEEDSARLSVILVDDEEPARRLLREYLEGMPGIRILAECANGFEAVKAATELLPDLLLLDIQMPKLDGFEVLELIGQKGLGVVFITAYDQYALRAFEVHAVDYLLKPFSAERLQAALERARERLALRQPLPVEALRNAARPPGPITRVLIRQGARVHVVPIEKIDYLEAQDDYVCVRSEGQAYLKDQTLAQMEVGLDPSRFVRIHRSYILHLDRLAKIELYAKDSREAILTDGTRLPVSRAGYARLKNLL